jgi:hypothetical protein
MSNSSRIEAATRDHVGAVLTGAQIVELVKVSDPDWKGGIYPSDAAGKLLEDGTITFRGKVAYGDLVLLHLAENSFKVLADKDIVRRPTSKKAATPKAEAKAEVKTEAKPEAAPVVAKKKAAKTASQIPVAPRKKGADARASQ